MLEQRKYSENWLKPAEKLVKNSLIQQKYREKN